MLDKLRRATEADPRDTMIAHRVSVSGELTSEGNVWIDGTFSGRLRAKGHVTIGASALVEADITCDSATIVGQLQGNLRAEAALVITATGRVRGDINTQQLDVEPGAILVGQVATDDPEARPKRQPTEAGSEPTT